MPSPVRLATKDPDEVKWYEIDWTQALASFGGDTIASVLAWVVPAGITQDDDANTTTKTQIKLSGGTHGVDYTLTCRIQTTTNVETLEQSIIIPVRDKDDVGATPPAASLGAVLLESGGNAKISALTDGAPGLDTDEIVIARAGVSRKLALADLPIQAPLIEILYLERSFTEPEVRTLGTAPIEILPAVPGSVYVPYNMAFIKDTADVFGGTGANIILQWVASTPIVFIQVTDSMLAVASVTGRMANSIITGTSQLHGEGAAEIGGKAIRITRSNGNDFPSGVGCPCTLKLYYYMLPSAI